MRVIRTLALKELGITFTTLSGYLALGIYSFVLGLVFVSSINRFQETTAYLVSEQRPELLEQLNFNDGILTPVLSTALWLFLFFVPFLTMRLFAEEKQQHSFELLMTTPVRSIEVVLGKYLAVSLVVLLMALMPTLFAIILHAYGSSAGPGSPVEWRPFFLGLFTLLALGLSFSGIGLLISALSSSQVVAALVSFAALLMLLVLPMVASQLEGSWRAVLEYLSPMTHVSRGLQGRLLFADLVYFASAILLSLGLTERALESHRWR